MEEKSMKLIGLIIGILVLGAGIYYFIKEKHDPQSRKIYLTASGIGAALAGVCALLLFL